MSAVAEAQPHAHIDDKLARRNAMVLSVAQALAGGNNTVIVSTASIVGALGDDGPAHLIDLYVDELRASLGQIGARNVAEARDATILHPGAMTIFSPLTEIERVRAKYAAISLRRAGTPMTGQ